MTLAEGKDMNAVKAKWNSVSIQDPRWRGTMTDENSLLNRP